MNDKGIGLIEILVIIAVLVGVGYILSRYTF